MKYCYFRGLSFLSCLMGFAFLSNIILASPVLTILSGDSTYATTYYPWTYNAYLASQNEYSSALGSVGPGTAYIQNGSTWTLDTYNNINDFATSYNSKGAQSPYFAYANGTTAYPYYSPSGGVTQPWVSAFGSLKTGTQKAYAITVGGGPWSNSITTSNGGTAAWILPRNASDIVGNIGSNGQYYGGHAISGNTGGLLAIKFTMPSTVTNPVITLTYRADNGIGATGTTTVPASANNLYSSGGVLSSETIPGLFLDGVGLAGTASKTVNSFAVNMPQSSVSVMYNGTLTQGTTHYFYICLYNYVYIVNGTTGQVGAPDDYNPSGPVDPFYQKEGDCGIIYDIDISLPPPLAPMSVNAVSTPVGTAARVWFNSNPSTSSNTTSIPMNY